MIGFVSESLRSLLQQELAPQDIKVTLLSPIDTNADQKRVNLFLYRVIQNPHLINQDYLPKPGSLDQLVHPPLVLNLFYLLTPFAPLFGDSGQANVHDLLAEAMRVLHEHAIVPQTFLAGGLRQGQVKVTLHAADVEELSKIWTALEKDLQLSTVYEVSFTEIPDRRERPMPKRVEKTSVVVIATDRRPAISGVDPRSGPPGTSIHVSGENLRGWKVTARIGGTVVASAEPVLEDRGFEISVPALAPGVYELTINISELTEFHDVVEVTP
jgi:hypothetical protein